MLNFIMNHTPNLIKYFSFELFSMQICAFLLHLKVSEAVLNLKQQLCTCTVRRASCNALHKAR